MGLGALDERGLCQAAGGVDVREVGGREEGRGEAEGDGKSTIVRSSGNSGLVMFQQSQAVTATWMLLLRTVTQLTTAWSTQKSLSTTEWPGKSW